MKRLSSGAFMRAAGNISSTLMRKLERLRVIRPERAIGSRFRTFSPTDVRAARRWIVEHSRPNRRRTARHSRGG
ncbi:MAG: hypothetical protein M0038_05570 [Pseudomonadota bacterium]|nr:hypothetical protein [Pseudomonadota bacterium]